MKINVQRLSVIVIVFVFISAIQLSAFAKPGANSGNEKKNVQTTNTVTTSKKEVKKVTPAKEVKKVAPSKIEVQLISIEKKAISVVDAVYGIEKEIDRFILVINESATTTSTPTPASTATPAPTPTTTATPIPSPTPTPTTTATTPTTTPTPTAGNVIKVQSIKGFVNGTTGKLNALTNRLAAIDKELKTLAKNPEIIKNNKYNILVNKVNMIKGLIKAQLARLKTISAIKK